MSPKSQLEILSALKIRDWARERLAWNGARFVEEITELFAAANDIALAVVQSKPIGSEES